MYPIVSRSQSRPSALWSVADTINFRAAPLPARWCGLQTRGALAARWSLPNLHCSTLSAMYAASARSVRAAAVTWAGRACASGSSTPALHRCASTLAAELGKLDYETFTSLGEKEQAATVERLAPLLESELGLDAAFLEGIVADTVNTLSQRETWERLAEVMPAAASALSTMDEEAATPEYHHVRFSAQAQAGAWQADSLLGDEAVPVVAAARESQAAALQQATTAAHAAVAAKRSQAAEVVLSVLRAAKGTLPGHCSDAEGVLAWDALRTAVDTVGEGAASGGDIAPAMTAAVAGLKAAAGVDAADVSRDAVLRDALTRLHTLDSVDVSALVAAQASASAARGMETAMRPGALLDGATVSPEHESVLHEHDAFEHYRHDHMRLKHATAHMSHKRLPAGLEGAAPQGMADAVRTLEDNPTFTPAEVARMATFGGELVASGGDGGELLDRDYGLWVSHEDIKNSDGNPDTPVPDVSGDGLLAQQGVKPEQHWKVDYPVDRTYAHPELFSEHPEGDALFREGTSGTGPGGDGAVPAQSPLSASETPLEGTSVPPSFLGADSASLIAEHFDGDEAAFKGFITWVQGSPQAQAAMRATLQEAAGEGVLPDAAEGVGKYTTRRAARAARAARRE